MGNSGWWFMGILMMVAWALVAAVIIWLLRRGRPAPEQLAPGADSRAGNILDERYARGELTDEEYRQHRELLRTR